MKDYWNHKDEEKRNNTLLWILAVIGAVAAVAAIAYAVYRYMTPDYLEDFEDDFDDDFEDDFFEDEESPKRKKSQTWLRKRISRNNYVLRLENLRDVQKCTSLFKVSFGIILRSLIEWGNFGEKRTSTKRNCRKGGLP